MRGGIGRTSQTLLPRLIYDYHEEEVKDFASGEVKLLMREIK